MAIELGTSHDEDLDADDFDPYAATVAGLLLATFAWLALWLFGHHALLGGAGPDPAWTGAAHHGAAPTLGSVPTAIPVHLPWIGGWTLMAVAMMLPPALPLIRAVAQLATGRPDRLVLLGSTVTAFIGVWVVAGAGLLTAATVLGRILDSVTGATADRGFLLAGAGAVLAGLYQFSGWKTACLTVCRSPVSLLMTRWTGTRPPALETADIGARFAAACVGCCWALMLLTLVVGNLALLVALAIIMAAERMLPAVRRFVPVLGVLTLAVGAGLLLVPLLDRLT